MKTNKPIVVIGAIIAFLLVITIGLFLFLKNRSNGDNQDQELKPIGEPIAEQIAGLEGANQNANGVESDDKKESESSNETIEEKEPTEEEIFAARIEEILDGMSLDEKIYQMFVVAPEQLVGGSGITVFGEEVLNKLKEQPIGGFIFFGSNVREKDQTKNMLKTALSYGYEVEGLPLFLGTDEEGGRVARIAGNPNFGEVNVGAMGKIKTANEALSAGAYIGCYMSSIGFNLDFAPDADVITVASNTAIGDRSFGSDPQVVSDFAASFSDGLHNSHILSTYKHYPGHGATLTDTHHGLTYINKTYEEMQQAELVPFAQAQENDIDMIMVAHISLPNITGDDTPCSLSHLMISDYLRNDMGYDGIVITDALNMDAVTNIYDNKTMAVMAVDAGNDILLMPRNIKDAHDAIFDAISEGTITEERINESVRRIIKAKLYLMDAQ